MTTPVDIVNRALQSIGSRTTVASLSEQSNEAFQANLILYSLRDQLLRMAPWNCCNNYANLNYITSIPGTPENTGTGLNNWQKGIPAPPYAYEYQYPSDCVRALFVIPAYNTGFTGGLPLTPGITTIPALGGGQPSKYKIGIDQFYAILSAAVASGGNGYNVGDIIVLAPGAYSINNIPTATPPIGAPGILQVTGVTAPGGAVTSVAIVNTFAQAQPENTEPVTGSYFLIQASPIAQGTTTGSGAGATFSPTWTTQMDQRVILTNQEFAILCYNKQVSDVNIMDPAFIDAWVEILAARFVYQLTGDKGLANLKVQSANNLVIEARKGDGNEGLTINDVVPDWMRVRGIMPLGTNWEYSPNTRIDWGNTFSFF